MFRVRNSSGQSYPYCQKTPGADFTLKGVSFHNRAGIEQMFKEKGEQRALEAMLQATNLLRSKGASEVSWVIPAFPVLFIGCGFLWCALPWLNSSVCSLIHNIFTVGTAGNKC